MGNDQALAAKVRASCDREEFGDSPITEIQKVLFPGMPKAPVLSQNGYRLPVLGDSPAIVKILETVHHVAPTDVGVLLTGPSGTGKGLVAKLIHQCSPRSQRPFLQVVFPGFVETLLESELFGHERGAFTGASESRLGRFELVEDGTIFLDEISDLPLTTQGKLLRVLQERQFERVGGIKTLTNRARVIAATNRDLRALVKQGRFREDLYYRLKTVLIQMPALRERRRDIPVLIEEFTTEFGMEYRGTAPAISPAAVQKLTDYPWPGNVRELRNCIESLVVLNRHRLIDVQNLPPEIGAHDDPRPLERPAPSLEGEKDAVLLALLETNGNRTKAAAKFGKSLRQFHRILRRHGL
jgi:transcriptional regulator with GAF, ATPase, and Fis domain